MARRSPKRPTPERLQRQVLDHLDRYSTPRAHLRRLLRRRLERALVEYPDLDREDAHTWLERALDRAEELGVLDDAAFARSRVETGLRRGVSPRVLAGRLAAKGVPRELVHEALQEHADPQLLAARNHVRTRRLGPWRPAELREEHRDRDLDRLGRAGFSYGVARRVLDEEG